MLIKIERWTAFAENAALICLWGTLASISFSNSLFEIFSSILMGLAILLVLARRDWSLFRNKWFYASATLILIDTLTIFFSIDPWSSARGAFRVLRCVMLAFFTVYTLNTKEKFHKTYHFFVWMIFLTCLDAVCQGLLGFELVLQRRMTPYTEAIGRVTGPFHHANDFAAFLSLAFFLGLAAFSSSEKFDSKKKYLYAAISFLSLICLLWTYARGAWIAVIISLVVYALFYRNKKILFSILGVFLIVIFLAPDSLKQRVHSLGNWNDGTMRERRILWGESLGMIQQKPLLGFGSNTYSQVEPHFKKKGTKTDFQYAHNGYLQIAAETGLIGLGSFLVMLLFYFSGTLPDFLRERRTELGACGLAVNAGIFSFLIHSATDTNLQSLRLIGLLWLIMGMGFAASRLLKKNSA